ncbi:MAG: FHA domain-containing protein [Deltaproteobacteria bacterium]|jgi:hypothetical protein|nr:FHA domain-containing protein [Deltaproteobacteria bacterium]
MTLPIKLESVYEGGSTEIATVDHGIITIGRHQNNTIIVDSSSVSRNHGELICAGSHWVFRDLGSTNGSFINDKPAPAGQLKLIKDNSIVCLSNFHISVSYLESKPADCVNSLLIFYRDRFLSEYIPQHREDVFYAGGEFQNIRIEGEDPHVTQFSIQFRQDVFSIQLFQIFVPILVNGQQINNFANLNDMDEILVDEFTILVNSQRTIVSPSVNTRTTHPLSANGVKHCFSQDYDLDQPDSSGRINSVTAIFSVPPIQSKNTSDEDYENYTGKRLDENDVNGDSSTTTNPVKAFHEDSERFKTLQDTSEVKVNSTGETASKVNKFIRSELVFDEKQINDNAKEFAREQERFGAGMSHKLNIISKREMEKSFISEETALLAGGGVIAVAIIILITLLFF